MSISITINDPANTSRADLALIITLLQRFHDSVAQDLVPGRDILPPLPATIAPDDLPSTGVAADVEDAQAAFAPLEPNPSAVFTPPAPPAGQAAPSMTPAGTPPAPPNGAQTAGAPTPDRDSAGLPWDGRIHAKGANGPVLNSDGTWRAKRGVSPMLVAQVEAELRGITSTPAPAPNVAPPPPPPATAPSAPASTPTGQAGAPAGTSASAGAPTDFVTLVGAVSPLMAAGKLTNDELNAACQAVGVPDMTQAMNAPEKAPLIWAQVQLTVAMKGA